MISHGVILPIDNDVVAYEYCQTPATYFIATDYVLK